MSEIELEDLLEDNPSIYAPKFQTLITEKFEYADLVSDTAEKLNKDKVSYFSHQTLTHRFLRVYDDYFILSETGSGKTGEVVGFIEKTRVERDNYLIGRKHDHRVSNLKRAVILVSGKTQKRQLIDQIVCKFAKDRFQTKEITKAENDETQKRAINRVLKEYYEINTYTKFANKVSIQEKDKPPKLKPDAVETYSNVIFWIDEAHNITPDIKVAEDVRRKGITYQILHMLFHAVKNRKLILSSATPMINNVNEIKPLLNLLLPVEFPENFDYYESTDVDLDTFFPELEGEIDDENAREYFQGQIPKSLNLETVTLEALEPYLRGRIGFVKAPKTAAKIENIGEPLNETYTYQNKKYTAKTVVQKNYMSTFQNKAYQRALARDPGSKADDGFSFDSRSASVFVFPDGEWGNGLTPEQRIDARGERTRKNQNKKILKEYNKKLAKNEQLKALGFEPKPLDPPYFGVNTTKVAKATNFDIVDDIDVEELAGYRRYFKKGRPTKEFLREVNDLDKIQKHSTTFHQIITNIENSDGPVFVFGENVEGSGIIAFGGCLEALGYSRFMENKSVFVKNKEDDTVCPGKTEGNIKPSFKPKLRYALYTGSNTENEISSMLELMNSSDNIDGDYIKVFVASHAGREGISVDSIRKEELIGPEWNEANTYQALSRGIRATSHDALFEREEKRKMDEILKLKENAKFSRKQFRDLGKPKAEAKLKRLIEEIEDREIEIEVQVSRHAAIPKKGKSIDISMYLDSERKAKPINRIFDYMKRSSVSCQIHKERNEIRNCVDPSPDGIDFTGFDLNYSTEYLQEISEDLIELFAEQFSISYEDILENFEDIPQKHIDAALSNFIIEREPIRDRFGMKCYLHESGKIFFISREYQEGNLLESWYSQNLNITRNKDISELIEVDSSDVVDINIDDFETTEEFSEYVDELSIPARVKLLEDALIAKPRSDTDNFILEKYKFSWFRVYEPTEEIKREIDEKSDIKPKKGRPSTRDDAITTKVKKEILDKFVLGTKNKVYVHTLYIKLTDLGNINTQTAAVQNAVGRKRLYKNGEWIDLNPIETKVYTKLLQIKIRDQFNELGESGFFGKIGFNDEFKIVAIEGDNIKPGTNCEKSAKSIEFLIKVAYAIGMKAPAARSVTDKKTYIAKNTSNKFTKKNVDELTDNELKYYAKWLKSFEKIGPTDRNTRICFQIREFMDEHELLYS